MSSTEAKKIGTINNWEKIVGEMERRTRSCLYMQDEAEVGQTSSLNTLNSCGKSFSTDNVNANGSNHRRHHHHHNHQYPHNHHHQQHNHSVRSHSTSPHHYHCDGGQKEQAPLKQELLQPHEKGNEHEHEHKDDRFELLPVDVRMSGNLLNTITPCSTSTSSSNTNAAAAVVATKVKNKQIKFCNLHKCKKSSKFLVPHRLNSQLVQSRLTKQLGLLKDFQFNELEDNFVENLCVKCKISYFEKQNNLDNNCSNKIHKNNINKTNQNNNCNNFPFEHKDNPLLIRMSRLQSKECTPSLTSRNFNEVGGGGGLSGGGGGGGIKKPFQRPFCKSRLDQKGNPIAGGISARMDSPSPSETTSLIRQNHELRQRLQDEAGNYRRRLDTYKQAQNNQAALVGRLQSKVLQYKQRCSELEGQMNSIGPPPPPIGAGSSTSAYCDAPKSLQSQHHLSSHTVNPLLPPPASSYSTAPMSLPCSSTLEQSQTTNHYGDGAVDDSLRKLEDERKRCEQLLAQNNCLRQQLEESHRTNEALTNDLQKLSTEWDSLRDELIHKEDEWKEEEQAFNDYYNNEHTRLLKMWREVVNVKRLFKEMQCSTKMDLGKLRCEISGANREVAGACSGVSVNIRHANKLEEAQQMHVERENMDLKSQLSTLRIQFESCNTEIAERDQRLQQLLQELKIMEERYMQAESLASQTQRLNDEIERLQTALRDIAHAVVQDADATGDAVPSVQHLHLSQTAGAPPRSPKRSGGGGARTSQAFAEGTISAVQAALHKYQLLLHDLQVKLQSNTDSLQSTKKQLDSCDNSRDVLTNKVAELTEKLDSSNYQLAELMKERDSLQKSLDNLRSDKHSAERGKAELGSIVDNLNTDYEKLQNINSKLQKMYEQLDDEKKMTEMELQRVQKDKDITEMNLRAEEEHSSRLREDGITLREEINKLYLSRDLLEQQRIESDNLMAMIEKQKMDLEFELEKVLQERCELSNTLERKSSSNDGLETEMKQLRAEIAQLEDENHKLKTQNSDQNVDLSSLKKELIAAEQARLELDSEKLTLSEKLKFLEIEKDKIDSELGSVVRERTDVSNQLALISRKKEGINEELMRLRQRLEQANEMNSRLNRNLEELVKENEEKHVIIEGHEKMLQSLQEQLASIRSEKDSLEAVLFDTNTTLESSEIKKDQLERDVQELLIKQESHKSHIVRLTKDLENCDRRAQEMKLQLTNAASTQEAEFLQKISNLRTLGEENIRKLNEEKEHVRQSLEKRMHQALVALESNKDGEIQSLKEQFEALQMHLDALNQQHEETMIRAENDKQQSLLLAHRDKQAVLERLESVMRELKAETENGERLRRELTAKTEKDRTTISTLREEIAKFKTKLEESRLRSEEEVKKLELFITTLKEERDNAQRDIEEFKVQIRLVEDKSDALNHQLQDTARKLKEAENQAECARRDLTDTRRSLADSNIERDKYAATNKELRDHIKRVEGQRREQSRSMEDAIQKIASLEENKNSLESERVRLSTILKETENNLTKTSSELSASQNEVQKMQSNSSQKDVLEKELQARLNNEIEEKDRVIQELHQVKKQMADLDGNLHATRQELGRSRCKANQDEHRWHTHEQELLGRMEEGRCREKRLEDQKHNLEVCLADATQQLQELKTRLGGAEGRIRALEEQIGHLECSRKDAENKLSSIGHTLRRIAGIQLDGTVTLPYRLMSPSRRYSPARGAGGSGSHHHHHHHQECHDNRSVCGSENVLIDVDPEMVRKGVRTLMQQVAQIERERDDYKAQLCTAKKQLQDASDVQQRCENKIAKLQQIQRSLQEDKTNLEAKLTQKTNALQSVEETLKHKSDELLMLREKVATLESSLASTIEEKSQCEDRLEKSRQSVARLESEKRHLQDELGRSEARCSKLDLQRVALEGDIQRLQMALQEKDCQIRNVTERLEAQSRVSAQLEDRCVALKGTVDQLKERVQSAAITETELRGELNCLQKERAEQTHTIAIGQDKIKQMQKTLTNSENERRLLSERLDGSQHSVNELRRSQQASQDTIQRLQEQVAEVEVQKSTFESQLRMTKWNQENSEQLPGGPEDNSDRQLMSVQRERQELRKKVDALNDKVRQLENEKHLMERDSKFSGHIQYDRPEKNLYRKDGDFDSNRLESDCLKLNKNARNGGFPCGLDHTAIEQESRELRMKLRRLETQLAEKEAELARVKTKLVESSKCLPVDSERYRSAQNQAERMLDAREQSHRQQVLRLENQISMLREQLAQEAKRRQMYILRSTRAGREMQQLRQTLGDSLRNIAQEPIDKSLLECESRRLDNAVTHSLPPSSTCGYPYDRSLSPTALR